MTVYRYIWRGIDSNALKRSVDQVLSVSNHSFAQFIDISLGDDNRKPDLDYEMDSLGYDFFSTSPTDQPPLCLISPNGTLFKLSVSNLGILSIINLIIP